MRRLFDVMLVIAAVAIGAAVAIPNLLQSRKQADEARAIGALKQIATSEAIFRDGDKELDGNLDYGTLSELAGTKLIDSALIPNSAIVPTIRENPFKRAQGDDAT